MKNILGAVIVGAIIVGGWFVMQRNEQGVTPEKTEGAPKVSVVATFYPLQYIAERVGGDRVVVSVIVPAGAEPHEYEPTQKDILSAYQADVFLINGAGVDAWAEKIRPELEARGVKVVQMSEMVTLLPGSHEEHESDSSTHEEERVEHEESQFDPHFWLDPTIVEKEALAIAEALGAGDEAGRVVYAQNTEQLRSDLRILDDQYRAGIADCTLDTVVTSHNAFSYMAKRYGFKTISIAGLSPEAEVSIRRLTEIADLVRERGVRHIFFETLVSPKVAETLAREVGAETLVFNPLEGLTSEERAQGKNYLSIMYENLDNLKIALQCQK